MERKKILYVTTEMIPYFPESVMSNLALKMPKKMHSEGNDVRIFMPRFGTINERRHQLHEVIRLSGMNLIINDIDQPLIIKVASVPGERMQVYFIDNEEYFKRKQVYADKKGTMFPDNDERSIFFAKGVLETVKKLNWKPDVINVIGWMSSMVPLYLKKYYADDAFFNNTKVVVSLFDSHFDGALNNEMITKLAYDKLDGEVTGILEDPTCNNLMKTALKYADAAVKIDEVIPEELLTFIEDKKIPLLDEQPLEDGMDAYVEFCTDAVMNEL